MNSTGRDIVRQSTVIAAAVLMLIGAAVGGGAFGGESVAELQNGALSAEGSYLAPAGPAFAIWSVIYLGLAAYTIWQALPGQRDSTRQRAVGWWVAASMVLNGLWLVTARYLNLVATVIVIAALLAVLARIIVLLGRDRASGPLELTLFDGVQGLHFGWVTIATVANTAAWLTQTLPADLAKQADAWGIGVLVVVAVIGAASAFVTRRLAPALATSWGLVWAAIGRLSGEPESTPIGVTALVVAAAILVAGVVGLLRARRPVR
ncbi:TspO/MBR family protein [Microbacterium sp. nov. GSS16]|uniref:TspO/MBR family protein n=1 Tax=Microbacterium sp. nov. GSS16 TaxID=3019890 RepID=UPI0023061992|nr:TspO/MBR family protein [Microbacterium sp. nov. GSS16]WCD93643.1 tryptophan-rich sensory protein [Microbacterium sp. nov. GSS16]